MHPQQSSVASDTAYPQTIGQVARLMDDGDYEGAIATLLAVSERVTRDPLGSNTLAYLLLHVGRPAEAIGWFEAMLTLQPGHPGATAGLGMACQSVGRFRRALDIYESAISLRPGDADNWYHRAVVLVALERIDEALASLDRAIAIQPDYRLAFAKRAEIQERLGDTGAAIIAAQRCVQIDPDSFSAWSVLGHLFQKQGVMNRALEAYDTALLLDPDNFSCLCNKGQVLRQLDRSVESRAVARRALELQPEDSEALLLAGGAEVDLGDFEAARPYFEAIARQGVACIYPATAQPARFRAMLLFSPLAGNTPYEDLLQGSAFDADIVIVLPGHHYDPAVFTPRPDVVINLIAEPDQGMEMLLPAMEIVDQLGLPVLNPPRLIATTDRQSIARRLSGLDSAVMPGTSRITAEVLLAALDSGKPPALPVIIREAGTHGGERMELAEDETALRSFAEEAGDQPLYLTTYVDYRSPDGPFPQVPVPVRRRGDPSLSPGHRRWLESAPSHHPHG